MVCIPVGKRLIFEMIAPDNDELFKIYTSQSESTWHLGRTRWFRRCVETGEVIWPRSPAYYLRTFPQDSYAKFYNKNPAPQTWLSKKGMVIRQLRGGINNVK